MTRTYTFVFDPEPEGGYTVTCPALPGLVTYGETIEEARAMARDAMEGLIEVMLERGESVPGSDGPEAVPSASSAATTSYSTNARDAIRRCPTTIAICHAGRLLRLFARLD
jgi:antitoxin HicB